MCPHSTSGMQVICLLLGSRALPIYHEVVGISAIIWQTSFCDDNFETFVVATLAIQPELPKVIKSLFNDLLEKST